jgi:hypothetical protein
LNPPRIGVHAAAAGYFLFGEALADSAPLSFCSGRVPHLLAATAATPPRQCFLCSETAKKAIAIVGMAPELCRQLWHVNQFIERFCVGAANHSASGELRGCD